MYIFTQCWRGSGGSCADLLVQELIKVHPGGVKRVQELLQRPKLQVLVDHVAGLLSVADSQEREDVRVAVSRRPRHLGGKLLPQVPGSFISQRFDEDSRRWFAFMQASRLTNVGWAKTALLLVLHDADVVVGELQSLQPLFGGHFEIVFRFEVASKRSGRCRTVDPEKSISNVPRTHEKSVPAIILGGLVGIARLDIIHIFWCFLLFFVLVRLTRSVAAQSHSD